jgi:hypothetical protein
MKYLLLFFFISMTLTTSVLARKWERIKIPGAKCGDGIPYSIFIDKKSNDQKKLAVEFMGGGVCWSMSSCYGPNLRTWIHPIPKLPLFSTLTSNNSILRNHSFIYFPYCTGDVFAGKHTAKYFLGSKVHHVGFSNIQKTISYLEKEKIIKLNKLQDLILYGSSAGGIAALIHAISFEPYLNKNARRTVVADSPGLHFGPDFWQKFTERQISDFHDAFAASDVYPDFNNGLVAPYIADLCKKIPRWNIGFLQGTKDLVMSSVFGEISPSFHESNIYSSDGIINTIKNSPNCHAWIKKTKMHTFLLTPQSSTIEVNGMTAKNFFKNIHQKNIINSQIEY